VYDDRAQRNHTGGGGFGAGLLTGALVGTAVVGTAALAASASQPRTVVVQQQPYYGQPYYVGGEDESALTGGDGDQFPKPGGWFRKGPCPSNAKEVKRWVGKNTCACEPSYKPKNRNGTWECVKSGFFTRGGGERMTYESLARRRAGATDPSFPRPSGGCPPGATQSGWYGFRKCRCEGGYMETKVKGDYFGSKSTYQCIGQSKQSEEKKAPSIGGYEEDFQPRPRHMSTRQRTVRMPRRGGCGCMRVQQPPMQYEDEQGILVRSGGCAPYNRSCGRCMFLLRNNGSNTTNNARAPPTLRRQRFVSA